MEAAESSLADALARMNFCESGSDKRHVATQLDTLQRILEDMPVGNFLTFDACASRRKAHHTTEYEYPSYEIAIPEKAHYSIPAPLNFRYREDPATLALPADANDTTYFTISAVDLQAEKNVPVFGDTLLGTMEKLKAFPGYTTLSMITFRQAGELIFRIQRQTTFHHYKSEEETDPRHMETVVYDLTEEAWSYLTAGTTVGDTSASNCNCVWARMLNDLYLRGSDRAYHAVKTQLIRLGGEELYEWDKARTPWNSVTLNTPRELFMLRLVLEGPPDMRSETRFLSYSQIDASSDLDEITVHLPCGHCFCASSHPEWFTASQDESHYLHFGCPECGTENVFSEHELGHLRLSDIYRKKRNYKERIFVDDDRFDVTLCQEPMLLDGPEIWGTLSYVMDPSVPATIMPLELHPRNSEEAEFVGTQLRAMLKDVPSGWMHLPKVWTDMSELLWEKLREDSALDLPEDAVIVPVPPGFATWVYKWMERAIYCMSMDYEPEIKERLPWMRARHDLGDQSPENNINSPIDEDTTSNLGLITGPVHWGDEDDVAEDEYWTPYDDLEAIGAELDRKAPEEAVADGLERMTLDED